MITQIDFYILNLIQNMRTDFLDFLMPVITFLGNGGAVWVVTGIIMLFFHKTRKAGITLLLSLLIGWLLSTLMLKNLIARERPFNTFGATLNLDNLLINAPSDRFSFPSGHTLSSFSASVVLLLVDKKIGIPALILAVLIAFSRMYLYVHFPTDIIGGIVLGIVFAVISNYIVNKVEDKINERKLSNNAK